MTEKAVPNFASGEVTLLSFAEIDIPPYSARQITETIEFDYDVDQARTWNGALRNRTPPQMRKFRVTWTCQDMDSPALDGVWEGMELTADCITEFSTGDALSTAGGERDAVPGSERTDDDTGINSYRPQLTVMVETYSIETGEWDAAVGWTLVAREV